MRKFLVVFGVLLVVMTFALEVVKDLDTAIKLSKLEKKKLLLIFEMKTCGYCKLLNTSTLKDPEVKKFLEINYITVIAYADENPGLFAEFKVRATPTCWFFQHDEKGRLVAITYVPGYLPPDLFLKVVKYVYKLPKESFKEYSKKKDDFLGERMVIEISEEDAFYVLKHDPLAVMAKSKKDYQGETKVYITYDEKLAEWLKEKAFRVLLIKKG